MIESKDNPIKRNAHFEGAFFVYILRTNSNQLYIGHTNNLDRREFEHKHFHNGAKFIKDNGFNFKIVYTEKFQTRKEAMKRGNKSKVGLEPKRMR